jgi:parvulin-like peptidyl-prolyl isomerase
MKKHPKKIYKIASAAIVLSLIIASLTFWLYKGSLTANKIRIFNALPLPMAVVGGQNIPVREFLQRQMVANTVLGAGSLNQAQNKNSIYDALINETKAALVAQKYSAGVSQKEIDLEYQTRASQTDITGKRTFFELLKNYGLGETDFKNKIIKPQLLEQKIKIWHVSQQALNKDLYARAESLGQKIKSGENMGALATTFSQDETSKSVFGDLGFVDTSEVLPELREPLSSIKVGEVEIIPSRFGLHIIRLEGKNGNQMHLRQIFLEDSNFDNWYSTQTQNIKVYKLLNL